MTEKCFDIGEIQSFLDGELDFDKSEQIARHVSACDDCAILMATAEEESSFAFSALEQEFNTLVPTQRLWTKINDSIEREKKSIWKPIFAFLIQPQAAAFASLLFVFVVITALLSMKPDAPTNYTAQTSGNGKITTQPTLDIQQTPFVQTPPVLSEVKEAEIASVKQNKNEYRVVKTSLVEGKNNSGANRSPVVKAENISDVSAPRENVLGEESYIKTIATLTQTVSSRKDEVLNSSARFAFERDLAVTDDAIRRMRAEVQQNPSNEAAKQVLRTSYQNKIDLLNSVAEKSELMASLK